MLVNSLFNREINSKRKFNSNYYNDQIVKTYFESKQIISKCQIDKHFHPGKFLALEFSQNGDYLATACETIGLQVRNSFNNFSVPKTLYHDVNSWKDLSFNKDSSKIFYSFNDRLYSVDILNDKPESFEMFSEEISMNGYTVSSTDNILVYDCDKKIYSLDNRCSHLEQIKIKNFGIPEDVTSLMYHPIQENIILMSYYGHNNDVHSVDLRNREIIMSYKLPKKIMNLSNCYAYYNKTGTQILVDQDSTSLFLFDSSKEYPLVEFNEFGLYREHCAFSSCFIGVDDEYVASSCGDCNIYIWKIPKINNISTENNNLKVINKSKFVLNGHNKFIKGIKYNHSKSILASYDKDKYLFWSPFPLDLKYEYTEDQYDTESNYYYRNHRNQKYEHLKKYFHNIFSYNEFSYSLDYKIFYLKSEKVFNMRRNIEKCFKQNSTIYFIHSFLINFKVSKKERYSKYLKKFKELLHEKEVTEPVIRSKYVSLFFEAYKIWVTKVEIFWFILFLKLHLRRCEKAITKLTKLSINHPSCSKLKKLEPLEKITLIMKAMVYDLVIIVKTNERIDRNHIPILRKLFRSEHINSNFFDKNFFKEFKFDFCTTMHNNDRLKLLDHYNDETLLKLRNSSSFQKKFKKEFETSNVISSKNFYMVL